MSKPVISIVIPSFGRPERLAMCLAALARQEGGPFETIVVDDGSPTPLAPVCAQAGDWVRCIRQPNAGPAAARNTGVRAAQGDFICFTDDDCLPHPGWAKALLDAQGGDAGRLVGGRVENAYPDNLFAEASQSISDWLYTWHLSKGRKARFFTSNNMGCSRQAFLAIGGFDESFPLAAGEDRAFGLSWQERAGSLVFAPGATIRHAHYLDLKGFWRQQSNYGRGARHLHARTEAEPQKRGRLEGPAFYTNLMLHPLRQRGRNWGHRLALTALACLSQLAVTRGYMARH